MLTIKAYDEENFTKEEIKNIKLFFRFIKDIGLYKKYILSRKKYLAKTSNSEFTVKYLIYKTFTSHPWCMLGEAFVWNETGYNDWQIVSKYLDSELNGTKAWELLKETVSDSDKMELIRKALWHKKRKG